MHREKRETHRFSNISEKGNRREIIVFKEKRDSQGKRS
jgi:hypothetical protein